MWLQPPEPEHDPEDVRRTAEEILSRPEYGDTSDSLMDRINRALEDLLDGLFGSGGQGGTQVPSFVSWLLLGVLVALVVGLVVWAVRSGGWGRRPRSDVEEPVILSADEHRSADAWRAEAERHEAEGRWREGLLCRYRALVIELVRAGVVPEVPGRTAGEYLTDVSSGRPEASPPFADATELFEAAWYGGVETGPSERDRFASLAEATLDRVRSAGASKEQVAP
jgi:hypothetical protein